MPQSHSPLVLTFTQLLTHLSSTTASERTIDLLDHHFPHLLEAATYHPNSSTHPDNQIRYHRHAEITAKFPSPTSAETACIDSLHTQYALPKSDAANLIRDYISISSRQSLQHVLQNGTDISSVVSLSSLHQFWLEQRRAAFSSIVTVLLAASDPRGSALGNAATAFLSKHAEELKRVILESAKCAITSFDDTVTSNATPSRLLQASWFIELLFGLALNAMLTVSDCQTLLKSYTVVAKRTQRFSTIETTERGFTSVHTLDGEAASVLFPAAIAQALSLRALTNDFTRLMPSSPAPTTEILDSSSLQELDATFVELRGNQSPETALLVLSWASCLSLRSRAHMSNDSESDESVTRHMAFAVSLDAFSILQSYASSEMILPEIVSPYILHSLWDMLCCFFTAFPPRDLAPWQVTQIVGLATTILGGMRDADVREAACAIWEAEQRGATFIGASALLTAASGVFPQTYRPLISFLSALAVDDVTAKHVVTYLSTQLTSVTERADSYLDALLVVEDDECDVLQSLSLQRGVDLSVLSQWVDVVRPTDEDVVYVQAAVDIGEDSYRPSIQKASIGIANASLSVVTWIVPWDGFGAINRILQFLHNVVSDQDCAMRFGEDVLDELAMSAADSMMLLERLFSASQDSNTQDLVHVSEFVSVVAAILADVADPGDRTRASWLTRSRQELILTASASCLASITSGSAEFAQYALESLTLTRSTFPLFSAVNVLADRAFPAVAAVSRVAFTCSRGDVVSPELKELFSVLPSQNRDSREANRFYHQWFVRSPTQMTKFLLSSALPLWLTSSVREERDGSYNQHLYWLLPVSSLDVISSDPNLVLRSPVVSAVFSVIVRAACAGASSGRNSNADVFLFPALRSALAMCYMALKKRNVYLQERLSGSTVEDSTMDCHGEDKQNGVEPTNLECALLKPDMIYALAVLSSGAAKKPKMDEFFKSCMSSKYRGYLPEHDDERFWFMNPGRDYNDNHTASFWRNWVCAMSARCLSLLFCCISQESGNDAIQVAWPSPHKSSFGNFRGGGDVIRSGYSSLIRGNCVAVIELLVTVLSCGQRAVSRSLFAPQTDSLGKSSRLVSLASNDSDKGPSPKEPGIASTQLDQLSPADERSSEIITSVVKCLEGNWNLWLEKAGEAKDCADGNPSFSSTFEVGQACLTIAACVRFLRVCWESHRSKWFDACWKRLKIWNILADLLRCDGSRSKPRHRMDFTKASDFPEPQFFGSKRSENLEVDWNTLRIIIRDVTRSVDIPSTLKAIAADILHLFSAEVVQKTSVGLAALQVPSSGAGKEDGREKSDKLPVDLFSEGVFPLFSDVFSEKWMYTLLSPMEKIRGSAAGSDDTRALQSHRQLKNIFGLDSEVSPSVEERSQAVSVAVTKLFICEGDNTHSVLRCFVRSGETAMRFGADYYFDVPQLLQLMQISHRSPKECFNVLEDVAALNMQLTAMDVMVEGISAFSAMSSAVSFADTLCPSPNVLLSYSSPQFGGKACRFLSRFLLHIAPAVSKSAHAVAMASEVAKLTSSLSVRLSADELEQTALTAVRSQTLPLSDEISSLNPVGQLCVFMNHALRDGMLSQSTTALSLEKLDIVRWLLLTSSKLANGPAFHTQRDLTSLTKTAISTLRLGKHVPFLTSAATVALSAVLEHRQESGSVVLLFEDVEAIFAAIRSLAEVRDEKRRENCSEIAANLLLIVARGFCLSGDMAAHHRAYIIRQLSGGCVHGFMPSESETIPTYTSSSQSRNAVHNLWCATLHMSSAVIPDLFGRGRYCGGDDAIRDVLEYCCSNVGRITRDSFNFRGDWPSFESDATVTMWISIARVEEAELATATLFKISSYAVHLRGKFPELLRSMVAVLVRYTERVFRYLKAEPMERWVRPVTRRERERSYFLRGEREGSTGSLPVGGSPSWTGSPGRSQTSPTPSRRSPLQALRAAVGDGARGSPLPPSPGFTPASPSVQGASSTHISSPLSPWGPYGGGLITECGLYFGEEVSRSLLRGLSLALGALRRFGEELDVAVFSTSMGSGDEPPGLGLLLSIMHHAGGEIQRGADGDRREYLMEIAESVLILTIAHVKRYADEASLSQGVRDELRKRVGTYVQRMRRLVPPPPASSLMHCLDMEAFWHQLK